MDLIDILGRPIAFHRCLVTITGSVAAGLLLSQAIYWTGVKRDMVRKKRGDQADLWFYKSREDWEHETGLSRANQETARKILVGRGFLEEKLIGVPATLHFRVNSTAIADALRAHRDPEPDVETAAPVGGNPAIQLAGIQPTGWRESSKLVGGNPANSNKEAETTTEITQETTQGDSPSAVESTEPPATPPKVPKGTRAKARAPEKTLDELVIPDFVDRKSWEGYLEMRRRFHRGWTIRALELVLIKLSEMHLNGYDCNKALDQSTERNYVGVFEPKEGKAHGNSGNVATRSKRNLDAAEQAKRELGVEGSVAYRPDLPDSGSYGH